MPRPPRIDYDDAWQHVMNRGRNHQTVFGSTGDRRSFLSHLAESTRRFEIEIHAFVLMTDHYHLLVHTPNGHLSEAMQFIGGGYTQSVNRANGSDGALFKGRFRSIVIDEEQYLVEVVRYIHNNPVKAGMVPRAADYQWSSHRSIVGLRRPPDFLHARRILDDYFGANKADFAEFVDGQKEGSPDRFGRLVEGAPDTARLTDLLAEAEAEADLERVIPATPTSTTFARAAIERYIAETCEVRARQLRHRKTGHRNDAGALCMLLLHRRGIASLDDIATEFGYRSRSGVATAIARLEARALDEPSLLAAIQGGLALPKANAA